MVFDIYRQRKSDSGECGYCGVVQVFADTQADAVWGEMMPKSLENKLSREAAKKGLSKDRAGAYVYGTMNKLGYMKGNKETAKGKKLERMMKS